MKKILIVEDEHDVARVVSKRLLEEGFDVVVAADAYQAIEFTHKEKPDLVVLDLMIPAGGGIFFLKKIRLSVHSRLIPVVVLTGIEDEEYKQNILDVGVDAYLEKPYDPAVLIKTIREVLDFKKES